MTDKLRAALAELVALKDLKDGESRLRQRRECTRLRGSEEARRKVDAMRDDYNRRKPLAWAAARAALAEQPAEPVAPNQMFGIIDPDYARVFTQARIIAWQYGYACLAHGSFTRDLDLLLVPWTDAAQVDDVDYFAPRIAEAAGLKESGRQPSVRPHGRKTWTLLFPGFADSRWVDLSVMTPAAPPAPQPAGRALTDEQIDHIRSRQECWEHVGERIEFRHRPFARAIERAHGIKSEGE